MARFISVVVATRDRGHIVGPTLEALTKLQYEDFEIIVVDQSADNRTERIAETMHATGCGVRYVRTAASGVSDGRNVGALLSSAEIVAYTDDDCIVDPQWLTCIDAELADATVSAVYGRLLPYEWQGRTGCEVALKNAPERAVYVGRTPPWHIGHGGNMAFRRSALLSIGGFDPLLGAGGLLCSGEDGDVAYRLLAAGHQVVYSPAALAFHRHWKDWSSQVAMERAYGIGAGAQFAKYLRCRDRYSLRLLLRWIWELGVRRVGAGLLKWQSLRVVELGCCQLFYPWLGILRSCRYPVDPHHSTYCAAGASPAAFQSERLGTTPEVQPDA